MVQRVKHRSYAPPVGLSHNRNFRYRHKWMKLTAWSGAGIVIVTVVAALGSHANAQGLPTLAHLIVGRDTSIRSRLVTALSALAPAMA